MWLHICASARDCAGWPIKESFTIWHKIGILTCDAGAIVGLAAMGHQAVRNALFPNLHTYLGLLQTAIHTSDNEMKRFEGCQCFGALLNAVGMAMRDRIKYDLIGLWLMGYDMHCCTP